MKKRRSKKTWIIPVIAAAVVLAAVGAFIYALKGLTGFYEEDMEEEQKVQELIDLAVMTVPPRDPNATPRPNTEPPEVQTEIPEVQTETPEDTQTAGETPLPTHYEEPTATPNPQTEAPGNTGKATAAPTQYSAAPTASQTAAQTASPTPAPTYTAAPGSTVYLTPTPAPAGSDAPVITTEPVEPTEKPTPTPPHGDEPQSPLIVDFDKLQQVNSDICAWIYNEGSNINYPVVYSTDNVYYLNHNYKKEHSNGGAIFVDYRNNRDFSDVNTIVYGHYMKSGTMFGHLANYKSQSYYNSHPYMWIYTPYGAYRLDIIAGMVTTPSSEAYTIFTSVEQMRAFLPTAVQNSKFTSNVDISSVTQIVTLSTCSYEYQNARFVVIGSLVPVGQ